LSGVFFAWKVSNLFTVNSTLSEDERARTYAVEGQLFFASADEFMKSFDFREALTEVTLDLSRAHIWDISAVQAIDLAVTKFKREGAAVTLIGMNEASETLMNRLGAQEGEDVGAGH
jgi:SulP family sulfate permease